MKTKLLLPLLAALAVGPATLHAQTTAFTYQGLFNDNGSPATGYYDLFFRLYDAVSAGNSMGSITQIRVPVTNGLFTVSLDFTSAPFTGARRWLQLDVRSNTVPIAPVPLLPRTELTATPYAIRAILAADAGTVGGQNPLSFVRKVGDTMTGPLNLPVNGLAVGGNQLIASGEKVGIGTASPQAPLHVLGPNGNYAYLGDATRGVLGYSAVAGGVGVSGLHGTSGNYGQLGKYFAGVYGVTADTASYGVSAEAVDGWALIASAGSGPIPGLLPTAYLAGGNAVGPWAALFNGRVAITGKVGIGTTSPTAKLHVSGNEAPGANIPTSTTVLASGDGFNNRFMSVHGDQAVYLSMFHAGYGELSTYDYGTGAGLPLKLNVNGGTVSVPVLEITGGADVSEPFQMSGEKVLEGSVVIIDEENPGQLKQSTRAYDTRVAGIVSGANGIQPGISLKQEGALDQGQNVALSGRVYVKVDAAFGAIKPGDLLTTSDTPGHAMKVSDPTKAQGAILGKAMTALNEGKGMVLVLVSLQ